MSLIELIIISFLVSSIGGFVSSWIFKSSVLAGSIVGGLLLLFWLLFWWIFFPLLKKFWLKSKNLSNLKKDAFFKSIVKFLLLIIVIIGPIFLQLIIVDFCTGIGFERFILFTFAYHTIALEVASSFLYSLKKVKYLFILGCLIYSILVHFVSLIILTAWIC